MQSSDKTSRCPSCGELTHEFDRHFAGGFDEVSFPVIAYYCPACDHIVVEAYHSETDRDIVIGTHDDNWRVTIPPQPPRPHEAFDAERITFRTVMAHDSLERRREIRRQIGRIVRPDDPESELCIQKPVQFSPEEVRSALDDFLRDAKVGSAFGIIVGDSQITIRLVVTNESRFKVQLERLQRRFSLPDRMTLYHFNEGRKYVAWAGG